jgi:hypothetical protein
VTERRTEDGFRSGLTSHITSLSFVTNFTICTCYSPGLELVNCQEHGFGLMILLLTKLFGVYGYDSERLVREERPRRKVYC